MPDVCLYFQVHQPNRLIPYDFFRIGEHAFYEDDLLNAQVLSKVAEKCYLPANQMFKRVIERSEGKFRMALSISGTVIEQMQHHRPDVLESFQELVATGGVELLAETYYHSLAIVHSRKEFERQVERHLELLEEVFSVRPRVFRNTELIYNNAIDAQAETMGFDGILGEGWSGCSTGIHRISSTAPRTSAASRPCCGIPAFRTTSVSGSPTRTGPNTRSRPRPSPIGW